MFQTTEEFEPADEQSPWQPIKDGMRFAVSPNMGLLYGAFIFTGGKLLDGCFLITRTVQTRR